MKINVTQLDIDYGVQSSCRSCPIALATKRLYPDAVWVHVGAAIHVSDGHGNHLIYKLSDDAVVWIQHFDCGDVVEPFSFEVDCGFKYED